MPTIVFLRQRGSRKSSAIEPSLGLLASGDLFVPDHGLPALGLLETKENRDRQDGRRQADQKHHAPRAGDDSGFFEHSQDDTRDGREHVAAGRERLEPPQRERPGPVRHDLGDQGDSHRELSSDSQAGQESIKSEVPNARRKRAQAREGRVAQDGQHHRLGAADPVAEDPEKDPSQRPTDHENHGGEAGLLGNRARGRGRSARYGQQLGDGRLAGQVE